MYTARRTVDPWGITMGNLHLCKPLRDRGKGLQFRLAADGTSVGDHLTQHTRDVKTAPSKSALFNTVSSSVIWIPQNNLCTFMFEYMISLYIHNGKENYHHTLKINRNL
jgi:hypothetical protein